MFPLAFEVSMVMLIIGARIAKERLVEVSAKNWRIGSVIEYLLATIKSIRCISMTLNPADSLSWGSMTASKALNCSGDSIDVADGRGSGLMARISPQMCPSHKMIVFPSLLLWHLHYTYRSRQRMRKCDPCEGRLLTLYTQVSGSRVSSIMVDVPNSLTWKLAAKTP